MPIGQPTSWQFFRFAFITFNFVLFALLPFIDINETCRIGMCLSYGAIARILCSTRFTARKYLKRIHSEAFRGVRGHTQFIDFLSELASFKHLVWDGRHVPYCLGLVNLVFGPTSVHLERCCWSLLRLLDRRHSQFHRRRPISVVQQLLHLCSPFDCLPKTLPEIVF